MRAKRAGRPSSFEKAVNFEKRVSLFGVTRNKYGNLKKINKAF